MPVIVEALSELTAQDVRRQIEQLYDSSPEFADGKDALNQLDNALEWQSKLYVAIFNSKIIGAVWSSGTGSQRVLEYIVIHPANRERGIAERLISELCRMEGENGVTRFIAGCGAIQRCLDHLHSTDQVF